MFFSFGFGDEGFLAESEHPCTDGYSRGVFVVRARYTGRNSSFLFPPALCERGLKA
jgi:hypothetical protein